jgi:hypothetical protein
MNDEIKICVRFDTHWRMSSIAGRKAVATLQAEIESTEQRVRKRRAKDAKSFRLAVEALLCNLLAQRLAAPTASLKVMLGKNAAIESDVYGRGHMAALAGMQALGLLIVTSHKYSIANNTWRQYSAALSTDSLSRYLGSLSWPDMRLIKDNKRLLVLRSVKDEHGNAKLIDWEHTEETKRMSADMQRVNNYLASLPVMYSGAQGWLDKPRHRVPLRRIVTPLHTRSARIFQNGTFAHGGRLEGCWHVQLSKAARRKHIRLAGHPIVHVDYRQMYLRMAYAHVGEAWPFAPNENGYIAADYGDPDGWKMVTNSLIASNKMLTQYPVSAKEQAATRRWFQDMTAREVYADVHARHPALVAGGAFGKGLAHVFRRRESDLIVRLMLELQRTNVACLPVHDCLIVPSASATYVATLMRSYALDSLGCDVPVSIE